MADLHIIAIRSIINICHGLRIPLQRRQTEVYIAIYIHMFLWKKHQAPILRYKNIFEEATFSEGVVVNPKLSVFK